MNVTGWLSSNAPGFSKLSTKERDAIMNFTFLWSLFEARILDNQACSKKMITLTHEWKSEGRLTIEPFSECLKHFQSRYFESGEETCYFARLKLRDNDSPELVRQVMMGENNDAADSISALLIVTYRLRNNLFHGEKWAYSIHGQFGNFTNANNILIEALKKHEL